MRLRPVKKADPHRWDPQPAVATEVAPPALGGVLFFVRFTTAHALSVRHFWFWPLPHGQHDILRVRFIRPQLIAVIPK